MPLNDYSVVIPSNRDLSAVRVTMHNLYHLCKETGITPIVVDNSKDASKAHYLKSLFQDSYLVSPHPTAEKNFQFGLSQVNTKYFSFLGDDDWLLLIDEPNEKTIGDDYICRAPQYLITRDTNKVVDVVGYNLEQNSPIDRLVSFVKESRGTNALIYAFWKTELYRNIAEVTKHHPSTYNDWIISASLVCEGKVFTDNSLCYKYNAANWQTNEDINVSIERLLEKSHLPTKLANHVSTELRVIDIVAFFGRKIGYKLTLSMRKSLINRQLEEIIVGYEPNHLQSYLEQCLEVIHKISPEAGDRYRSYVEMCVDTNVFSRDPN